MSNKKVITGSATLVSGSATIHGTGTVTQAIDRIEASREIPADAKAAIKDFIHEKFNELQEHASELMDFPVPDAVAEWWPIVIEILKQIFS